MGLHGSSECWLQSINVNNQKQKKRRKVSWKMTKNKYTDGSFRYTIKISWDRKNKENSLSYLWSWEFLFSGNYEVMVPVRWRIGKQRLWT